MLKFIIINLLRLLLLYLFGKMRFFLIITHLFFKILELGLHPIT